MKLPLITLLFIMACVVNIAATPRKQVCPLQCYCNKRPDLWIDVKCTGSDFSSVPQFPDRTIMVTMQKNPKLRRIQSYAFSTLLHLQNLKLQSQVPWRVSETAFHRLANLKSLILRTTHSNPLSKDVFADLKSLTELQLSLKLVEIPHHQICKLHKLKTLGLADNELRNVTFDECFSSLSRMSNLLLTRNPIRVLGGSEFKALRFVKLFFIALNDCQLTEIGPDTFLYLKHLKTLSLAKNKLTSLPSRIFCGLVHLTRLSLKSNLLTTIPCSALAPLTNIVGLTLSYNKMSNMTLCPEFRNLTALRELYIVSCRISSMDDDFFQHMETTNLTILHITVLRLSPLALRPLKRLQYLSLQGRIQNSTYLLYVMQGLEGSDIQRIVAVDLGLGGILKGDLFRSLAKTNLLNLKMHKCEIEVVSVSTFSPLSKLEVLDLSYNRITNFPVGTFRNLVSLQRLILISNYINGLALDGWLLQDNLREINLEKNNIRHLGDSIFKGLNRLEKLNLDNNVLERLPNQMFTGTNIKQFRVSKNHLISLPSELLRTAKHLEIFVIKGNEITLTKGSNPDNPFAEWTNVTYVELANFIIASNFQHVGTLFNDLRKLKTLKLTAWRLRVLPVSLFVGTHNLELLVLTQNEIASWDPKLFQPLYKLTEIELDRNKIVSINKEAFSYLPNLRRLGLSGNAMACNCELMWFREWIETAFIYIPDIQNKKSYHCEAPERFKGVAFLDFSLSETDCIAFSLIKVSVTFSTLIVLLVITAGLVYRFRFEVQMFMFYVKSRQQRLLDGADTLEYVYDAYVIYSSEDRRWVLDQLMAYLENSQGYRLCIEDRDWLGGKAIADNIIESIESSRRVILVLSLEFVKNHWCVETAEMAQSHLLNRNNNALIPILLSDIPPENRQPSIRSVFTTRTLLPWPKGDTNKRKQERKEEKFWKTLNSALKKRTPQNVSGRLEQGEGTDTEMDSVENI